MSTVTFPIFNLKLNLSPIAFSLFGVDIYWYAIFIVLSMVLGILICKKRDGLYGINFENVIDLMLFLIPISIICARLYYVIFAYKDFIGNPLQILNFRTGGLAIYGGLIGGGITSIVFCKKRNIKLLNMLDYIAPCVVLGQAIGRWGNFVNIEAYGVETTLPWRMGIYEFGKYIEVHPTFLYESISNFILFFILINIKDKRKFEGQLTYIYLIWYGITRTIVEGLRTDSLMLGSIRISQIVSIIIAIMGLIFFYKNIVKKS